MQHIGEIHGTGMVEKSRVRKRLTGKVERNSMNEWKNIAPCHPKQLVVKEFFRAKKAALANVSARNISQFALKWRP